MTRDRNERDKAIALLNETLQLLQDNISPHNDTGLTTIKEQVKKDTYKMQNMAKAFYDLKSKFHVTGSHINSTLSQLKEQLLNVSTGSQLQNKILKENIGTFTAELSSTLEEEIQQVQNNISAVKDLFSKNIAEYEVLKSELSEIKLIQDKISISDQRSTKLEAEMAIMNANQRQMGTKQDEMFAVITAMLFDDEDDVDKAKLLRETGENPLLSKLCWTSFSIPFSECGYTYSGNVDSCQSKSCCLKRQIESSDIKNNTLSFSYNPTNSSYLQRNYKDIRIHMDSLTNTAGNRGDVEIYVKMYHTTFYDTWMPICFYHSINSPFAARIAYIACKQIGFSNGGNITTGINVPYYGTSFYLIEQCSENVNRLQECQSKVRTSCSRHLRVECNPM